ncbi:MAG: thioredoxin domain-containing protein [Alphaproteobacteria bacterium]|nr:thioredoxin domain-containing protein [Alphaproteobacteria bacterium]MCW5739393.1 thioredoxin domain-containing protein [Alphaproteobacteria bacterium]
MRWLVRLVAILAALALAPLAQAQSGSDRAAIEKIIKEYLIKNPEVLVEALQEYERRQGIEKEERAKAALVRFRDELANDALTPVGGNPKGDVTIVEFFDYNCGYCRRAHPTLKSVVAGDGRIRIVHKQFPILSEDSKIAARMALAAHKQGKYFEVHNALMEARGQISAERMAQVIADLKLDAQRLTKDMDDPAITQHIDKAAQLARALGVNGTPAFIIGTQLIPGAVDADTMKAAVAKARKG